MNNKNNWLWPVISIASLIIIIVMLLGPWPMFWSMHHIDNLGTTEDDISYHHKQMQESRDYIISNLITQGDYACCLDTPCTYCISEANKHGEGATCQCLNDIVNGKHPCGECIGEILEGHGNKYLAKYFAQSLADELGETHLETLRKIISEKYQLGVSEQL